MTRTFLPHVITDDSALGGAEIERSFRFNDNDGAHLSRTPSGAGNRKVWTWSGWVKRGNIGLGANATMLHAYDGSSSNRGVISFNTSDQLKVDQGGGSGVSKGQAVTTAKFRDPSAWYHIVVNANYSDSTASDRVKVYVNGTQQTLTFNVAYTDENGQINGAFEHEIGAVESSNSLFDGYMAEIHFTDGYNYDASYFGYTEQQTGIWRHKKVTGITYGTNGFYLDFSDNSSITNICLDKSGNANNFSPDNCNTEDSMIDTPTNNFAVMNPLTNYSGLSQGNLRFNNYNDSGGNRSTQATIALPKSGKWYWEARYAEDGKISTKYFGVSQIQMNTGYLTAPYVYYDRTHIKNGNNSEDITHGQDWYNGVGVPAILGCAVNVDNNTVSFYHNNTLQGTITLPTLTPLQEYLFTWANTSGGSSSILNDTFNFGADSTFQGQVSRGNNTDANGIGDFKYAVPSGHLALCSKNIPTKNIPSVIRPKRHFDTLLYTGNSSTQKITGLEFKPDMIWFKSRTSTNGHGIADSVRGRSKLNFPDTDQVEETSSSNRDLVSFDDGGFTLGNPQILGSTNNNGQSIVAWCWKAGGNSSTYNIDGTGYGTASAAGLDGGSINPTGASVNTESGFGIYTYTGTGSNATIAHGLGTKPAWILVKNRNATSGSSTENWTVYHQRNTDNPETDYLTLNGTSATADLNSIWNDTEPTSSLISIGTHPRVNDSASVNYIMYVWSEIPGFSKFGRYTGNGSSSGTYVDLGFKPAFLILKRTDDSKSWILFDNKRNPSNLVNTSLYPNRNDADNGLSNLEVDFLSNGFKLRNSVSTINYSGGTYVYFAFAEEPVTTPFDTFPNAR